jgi:hypothetical protein
MAEALKTFREGEDILASETNENNQFLLSKLSDNAAQVQSYVEGEVATIKSNVASVQATLQNNIDLVNETVQAMYTNLMPDYSKGTLIESGYEVKKAGFITISFSTVYQTSEAPSLKINDAIIAKGAIISTSLPNYFYAQAPVSEGDVITFPSFIKDVNFYPLKGVANDD